MTSPKSRLKVYEYSGCSTCKKALKFLDGRHTDYEKVPILETPPSEAELRVMLKLMGGEIRKLFNTSGQAYREMGLGAKLSSMDEKQALRLLASNGRLVKRPFAIRGQEEGAVGFKEADWKKLAR